MPASVPLSLHVLGVLELARRGERVSLPRSKKTRALLAYLAVTGRPHRREHQCSLLWEDTDDPQGNLRWSLTKLRSVIDGPKRKRLVANDHLVELDRSDIEIDLTAARRECAGALASVPTDRLERLANSFRGEFLEGLELPDSHPFHTWCLAQREDARRLHAQTPRLGPSWASRLAATSPRSSQRAAWGRMGPAHAEGPRPLLSVLRPAQAPRSSAPDRRRLHRLGRSLPTRAWERP